MVCLHHSSIPQGAVYIPFNNEDMITRLVCNKFRQRLSEELVVRCSGMCVLYPLFLLQKTRNHLPMVDDDERIAPMLKTIKHRYLGEDFSNAGEKLQGSFSLAQIDTVSVLTRLCIVVLILIKSASVILLCCGCICAVPGV